MNHLYAEAGVKRKGDAKLTLYKGLMILGMIIGGMVLLFGGNFGVIGAAIITVLILFFPRLNIDYEYVFVDGQIDFDRISGKAKRKTLLRVDMEQVEIIAPERSHALDNFKNGKFTLKDFSSGDKNNSVYVIICTVKGERYKIMFEPTEKMVGMMRQKSPRKVAQY